MLLNYIKIAWRGLVNRKAYSFINITGLAIGIAACLLLFIVVRYELSYNTFQKNYARIYHVVTKDKYPDGVQYNSGVPVPALASLRVDFPDVQFGAIQITYGSQVTVASANNAIGNKFIEKTGIMFCETQFLDVFQQQWLAGDKAALANPGFAVLSAKTAEKYFGSWQMATGKTIMLDNKVPLTVAGIIKDPPANTDFPLSVLISFKTVKENSDFYGYYDNWNALGSNFEVYALAPEKVTADNINNRLLSFSAKHYKGLGNSIKTNFIQPLSDIHFDERFDNLGDHKTSKSTLFTLSLIAVFIVLMACINFVNLSTAQAVNRSKEIGVRKAMGGSKLQLFWQVMGETAFLVLAAVVLATIISIITLPFLTNIASIPEQLTLFNAQSILLLFGIGLSVTVVAGIYPSVAMSRFNPILALKSKFSTISAGGMALRRSLVVLQFAISQVLIAGTIVAITQMNFVHNANLGFNKDAVLVLFSNNDSTNLTKIKAFKRALQALPEVQSVSNNMDVPSSDNNSSTNFAFNHQPDEKYPLYIKFGDEDYMNTFGLKLVFGRNYTAADTVKEVLINETLAKKLSPNNPTAAVGKTIRISGNQWTPIVGIVSDFKQNSLREEVKPMYLATNKQFYQQIAVKLHTNNFTKAQSDIEKLWNQYYPQYTYNAQFMDEGIANFYKQDDQLSLLYKIFAGLAIFISCLGLYGLVSFMAVQRTKEMGIRKVLGASIGHIVYLFSKEFTLLILLSFVIAVPVAYFMMNSWLENFAYRITMGVWIFAVAIVVSIVIAWVTVGYKAVRTAMANPVKSLRTE